jgi:hypothetical protein
MLQAQLIKRRGHIAGGSSLPLKVHWTLSRAPLHFAGGLAGGCYDGRVAAAGRLRFVWGCKHFLAGCDFPGDYRLVSMRLALPCYILERTFCFGLVSFYVL